MLRPLAAQLLRGLLPDPMISIIVPTIQGREQSLERTLDAYRDTLTLANIYEFVVIRNASSWSSGCNQGARQALGEILHFTADDLEPLPGWWQTAVEWLNEFDELPAPRVFNHSPDGEHDNVGDGPDGALTLFTRIPIMRRDQYDRIGEWPDVDYASDVWLSEKARQVGINTRLLYGYAFVHHWSQIGRTDTPQQLDRAQMFLQTGAV